jgi:hypothetical protein
MIFLSGIRVEPDAFEEMFAEADATGHGKIAFPEFMAMMGRRMKQVYFSTTHIIALRCSALSESVSIFQRKKKLARTCVIFDALLFTTFVKF